MANVAPGRGKPVSRSRKRETGNDKGECMANVAPGHGKPVSGSRKREIGNDKGVRTLIPKERMGGGVNVFVINRVTV